MTPAAMELLASIVSGLVGGVITGVAAFAAIRVELRYFRRDIDNCEHSLRELWNAHHAVKKGVDNG